MKVLIVDDNRDDRAILRIMFQAHGCSVREADNGRTGLAEASSWEPDLIVSDALMPEMDGFQFLRRAKGDEQLKKIPFVFYSAVYTGRDEEKLALSLGAHGFLVKPMEPELLWEEIECLLTRPPAAKEATPQLDAHEFMDEYSHIIVSKLEEKVHQLEKTQKELYAKQQQLEDLNRSLEQRIDEKVAKLREMDQVLIQQDRFSSMGEVLNNIAHQWRQPLNSVALMVQSLKLHLPPEMAASSGLGEEIAKIMALLKGLSATIDNFRTFFSRDADRGEFLPSEAVSEVIRMMGASLESNGIAAEVEVENDLPVAGSRSDFCQAVMNIVNNARDVLLERRVSAPRIVIRVSSHEGCSVVTIADNGGGIEQEALERLFDPYFTTKFPSKGKGICMYMSKVIIEKNMGGRLTARNIEGGAELRIEVVRSPEGKGGDCG